ncbi:hypothetical protein WN944_004714 [Citrus x changshan-huyou]|uniref:Mal d 1-associated protein n=1 Tax=Citrus x changshan-huyou TaxID=2935761 RepID=A0AAP0M0W4_9ROSI|nr:hypothetical protein CUMW_004500 [Citrus unshiu]
MGWVWRDDEPDEFNNSENPNSSSIGDRCSTRKVVRSQCKTEEVEPGKFIRKCEKTEEVLRDCIGRPVEVLKSDNEYTEEDVTEQVVKGSHAVESFDAPFNFPGLRSDLEKIERDFLGGIDRFFEAAEEMRNGIFDAFRYNGQSSSSAPRRRGVPIEGPEVEALPKPKMSDPGHVDFSGLARDV